LVLFPPRGERLNLDKRPCGHAGFITTEGMPS
jgi:hypothetical protein